MSLHHSFDIDYAAQYGIECAILIHHFEYWIRHNQQLKRNFYDGRTWMYQTQAEIAAHFPYMSEDTVHRHIKKLVEKGVIMKGNYNRTSFDRTVWYAFVNEEMFTTPRNRGIEERVSRNPSSGIAEPIPDAKTDTKKQQQQQPPPKAAAPPPSAPTPVPVVAVVFSDLMTKLDIPLADKHELASRYDAQTIDDAIRWATHPSTKIATTLIQAIKWACQKKPSLPAPAARPKQSADAAPFNRSYYSYLVPYLHEIGVAEHFRQVSDHVETPKEKIYFKERTFLQQISNAIRKLTNTPKHIQEIIDALIIELNKQLDE